MSSICNPTALGWISANPNPPWNVGQTINFKITVSLQSNNSDYECNLTSATATLYVNGNSSGSTSMTIYGSTATGTINYTIPSSYSSSSLTAYAIINYQYTITHRPIQTPPTPIHTTPTPIHTTPTPIQTPPTPIHTTPTPIQTTTQRTVYYNRVSTPQFTQPTNTQPTYTTVKTVVRSPSSKFLQPQ